VARSHAARSAASAPNGEAPPIDALLGAIFRRYGDHLYTKGDFDGAMAQFVKTIGVTQPSYVIRKVRGALRSQALQLTCHYRRSSSTLSASTTSRRTCRSCTRAAWRTRTTRRSC
jgi:hypothetical protein